jgi:hypothetical protein
MAAATKVLVKGQNRYIINVTGAFNSSDETDTIIVDCSALIGPDGTQPVDIRIDEITWAVGAGFDYVLLEWKRTADEVIEYLTGQGYMDYRPYGGKCPSVAIGSAQGDVALTTSGGAAGDTYSILINCRLKD